MNIAFMRLKPVARHLKRLADADERIANALEAIARNAFGLRLTPPTPAETPDNDAPDLAYADDASTAIHEAEEELQRLGYRPPPEGE